MLKNGFTHPLWMTYHQARQLGGQVRRGEKSSLSVFYKPLEVIDDDSDEIRIIPMIKANRVFNCDQIDNLPEDCLARRVPPPVTFDTHPCIRAEAFIQTLPATRLERDSTPLVAELTASFLCPAMGIEPLIDEEHAPYLQHYIHLLKDDPKAFVTACSQAEKAADYLKAFSGSQ